MITTLEPLERYKRTKPLLFLEKKERANEKKLFIPLAATFSGQLRSPIEWPAY